MARPAFKIWWTRFIPPATERATFVLVTCAILILMVSQWRPLPEIVWRVENSLLAAGLTALSFAGFGIVLVTTFLIDHFELFGLKQTWRFATERPSARPHFVERLFYRWVRHPLMTGFLIAFWATPLMTQGHLLFAVVTTAYILIGIRIEERDLVAAHGESYLDYRRRVPALVPFGPRG
jgi:protein-S-isoprenylcysteine O-methyltransferase Ste14